MSGLTTFAHVRGFATRASKPLSAAADVLRPRRHGIVILIYHRVGTRGGIEMDLPTELFARQMARIAANGPVLDLDTAVERLEDPLAGAAAAPVVVTFDDGTVDFVETALPVLVEHRVPATLYVATDHLERRIPFPHDGRPVSWAALRDALDTGLVTVGSHTHTHALLDRIRPDEADEELRRSSELIEDRLGVAAEHFAYPKAVVGTEATEALVRRRFRSAALAGTRPNPFGRTDVHRLARTPIQAADGLRWFERKRRGGMGLEDDLRRVINRRRYANATS